MNNLCRTLSKLNASCKQCRIIQHATQVETCSREYSQQVPLKLSQFPLILKPRLTKAIKGMILRRFIIQPYLDQDFNIRSFVDGAKEVSQKNIVEI